MLRRNFLGAGGLAMGYGLSGADNTVVAQSLESKQRQTVSSSDNELSVKSGDWTALRDLFPLTKKYIQLSTFLLASHPRPVSDEISRHRQALDENPSDYWHENFETIDAKISAAAASYMGGQAGKIALTDSTTMGLAMVYSGLKLNAGTEVLQTTHDHYSTDLSLELRAKRTGATIRRVSIYENASTVTADSFTRGLLANITDRTSIVAVTWVHSSTGVKLPIRKIADEISALNQKRSDRNKILLCVDGVHGFGIENQDISKLGCDFFIAGTHKWLFGPRGTGVVWGNEHAWSRTEAVIPSFSRSYDVWLGQATQAQVPIGEHMSPGGFHSFEHRWALPAAFKLHLRLGKAEVQERIHQLNRQTKEGLAKMKHVTLHTPMSSELSSGLVCFDVAGMTPSDVVKHMHKKGVIMSSTPYRDSHARFAPSLINNEQEIEIALSEINALA